MSLEEALGGFPTALSGQLRIAYDEGGSMVKAMLDRGAMPPGRALMAGLALDPVGRKFLDDGIENFAEAYDPLPTDAAEVVIGSGAHAATYCAVRRSATGIRPVVLERDERFGGTFAMTRRASFFLNSRNRPGGLGLPGSRDALNVIPGAPMQPSDIGGFEYQANADLGLVIRCTLALNSVVRTATVQQVAMNGDRLLVITDRGTIAAGRVIIATGLGAPRELAGAKTDGGRILSYMDFMRRFDDLLFPLDGLGRVAVVGGGDSGKTVVEALAGYGPTTRGSVASLDYVDRIDWYGIEPGMSKQRWLECNRTRYKPLAALFQDGTNRNARVRGFGNATDIYSTLDGVRINAEAYDTVVICVGFGDGPLWRQELNVDGTIETERFSMTSGGTSFGRADSKRRLVLVGPAADLSFESSDPEPRLEENRVALFRLAPRTAAMAVALPVLV